MEPFRRVSSILTVTITTFAEQCVEGAADGTAIYYITNASAVKTENSKNRTYTHHMT